MVNYTRPEPCEDVGVIGNGGVAPTDENGRRIGSMGGEWTDEFTNDTFVQSSDNITVNAGAAAPSFLGIEPDGNTTVIWHFDEGSGDELADSGPNSIHGTIHGTNWTTGVMGDALDSRASMITWIAATMPPSICPPN